MEITPEQYQEMLKLINQYENQQKEISTEEQPYFRKLILSEDLKYNPKYGDDRICECGHTYYRHFDSYEDMDPVGCKYCSCYEFKEDLNMTEALLWWKDIEALQKQYLITKYFPNGLQFTLAKSTLYIYMNEIKNK